MSSDISSDLRINVRLSSEDAARDSLGLLAGFIGSGEGPGDLSTRYKQYLSESLETKIPLSVQEPRGSYR